MDDATTSLEFLRDFVNTFNVESQTDTLASSGLVARGELGAAIEVREALRELLLANNHLPADVERASRVLDRAARRAELRVHFAGGTARVLGRRGLGRILAAAADASGSPEWPRLKACRAENCHWAFVDHAKNRSRAWCDMKTCGNRQKAQRFRERHAGA